MGTAFLVYICARLIISSLQISRYNWVICRISEMVFRPEIWVQCCVMRVKLFNFHSSFLIGRGGQSRLVEYILLLPNSVCTLLRIKSVNDHMKHPIYIARVKM